MSLRLYNTLTRTKEPFAPLDPKNVRLYVCGPTVYDYAHIGNARPVIVFDVLFRLLRHLAARGEWDGGKGETKVTYVRNITDIDDKINARAKERLSDRNVPILDVVRELTTETGRIYDEDTAALGCLRPTHEPRATKHVPQMIAMIETLIGNGHAYVEQGHVLYDVSSKPDYGKLSRRSLDEMLAGARVEVAPYKRGAMDFVLWKPSDADTPGWESPWGRGRPGWHIECSAMSAQYLGETFDIHGGGIDLMFPHHENEIAQSESAHHNHPLAKVWMHNGFLNVEGEKMSKSLGNFVTIHELLQDWPGSVLKFQMLMTHYRQPIDWTWSATEQAAIKLDGFSQITQIQRADSSLELAVPKELLAALEDDLNTPRAITVLYELEARARTGDYDAASDLLASCNLLGIELSGVNLQSILRRQRGDIDEPWIQDRIAARNAARKAKDFKESDRIRDELAAKGIVLKDGPSGTTWEVKR
ncbi:MAG TPA: cysteine--tRNA ligase [Rhizomicrobium sp.]|nr:cysteine--tRNA ligase [Rhizomicrobium sp.]